MSIEMYAHRDGSDYFAENTLAALSHAIDLGCAGAELDVHLTRDGAVVVHHDARLNPAFCRKLDGFKPNAPEQLPQAVEQAGGDVVFAYHADVEQLHTWLLLGLWSVNAPFTDLRPYQKAGYLCLDYPFLDAPSPRGGGE
jgi:glycerophosphoryl diester phosphodiesterase